MPAKWDHAEHTLYVTPAQFDEMRPILADADLSNADRNQALLKAGGMDDDFAFLMLFLAGSSGQPLTIAVRDFRQ